MSLDEFALKDLKSVSSDVWEQDIMKGRSEKDAFVHCECALAMSMKPLMQECMEIVVSKDCC
jgi:hypothetical protein